MRQVGNAARKILLVPEVLALIDFEPIFVLFADSLPVERLEDAGESSLE